jgi:hypothetical protein
MLSLAFVIETMQSEISHDILFLQVWFQNYLSSTPSPDTLLRWEVFAILPLMWASELKIASLFQFILKNTPAFAHKTFSFADAHFISFY